MDPTVSYIAKDTGWTPVVAVMTDTRTANRDPLEISCRIGVGTGRCRKLFLDFEVPLPGIIDRRVDNEFEYE